MQILSRSTASRFLLALLTIALTACDNPVEDEHEDAAVGLVVLNAQGQQVASYRVAGGVTGQVNVARATPATFTVAGIGEDGDQVTIDGDEIGLRASVVGGVGTVSLQNPNRITITGTQLGSGTLQLILTHEGHDEFQANIPLTVGS